MCIAPNETELTIQEDSGLKLITKTFLITAEYCENLKPKLEVFIHALELLTIISQVVLHATILLKSRRAF